MFRVFLLIFTLASTAWWGPAPHAQEPSAAIQEPALTLEEADGRLERVKGEAGLEAQTRDDLVERLTAARGAIERADAAQAGAARFEDAIAHGTERAKAVRDGIEDLVQSVCVDLSDVPEAPATEDVERLLGTARSDVAAAREEHRRREATIAAIAERAALIGTDQTAARESLTAAEAEARAARPADEPVLRSETVRFAAFAAARAARERIAMLDLERSSASMRRAQAEAERDAASSRADALDERVRALTGLLEQRREHAAAAARAQAEAELREAAGKDPGLVQIAAENAALTEELTRVVADTSRVAPLRELRTSQRDQLQSTFTSTRAQLERSGVRGIGSRIVVDQRAQVPELVRGTRGMDADWLRRIPETDARRFEISIERSRLSADLDVVARTALETEESDLDPDLLAEAVRLLVVRVGLLQELDKAYAKLLEEMRGLEVVRREFEAVSHSFTGLLDEWLLWIPTSAPIGVEFPMRLWKALQWLFDPTSWAAVVAVLADDARSAGRQWGVFLLVVFVLLAGRRRLRASLRATGGRVGDVRADSFASTARALVWTVLLAAPLPLVLYFVGSRLMAAPGGAFAAALGAGLLRAGTVATMLVFFGEIISDRGLAEMHLRWSKAGVAAVRRLLRWSGPVILVAVAVFDTAQAQPDEAIRSSLGRLAILVVMVAAGATAHRLLWPAGVVVAGSRESNPRGLLPRYARLWYTLGVGLPAALVILAVLGFAFAAENLAGRFARTVGLVIAVAVVQALAWRWFRIRRGQLAYQEALRARASAVEGDSAEPEVVQVDEALDLAAISDQGRQLLRTVALIVLAVGAWWIWSDVLPAFAIFDRVELWPIEAIGPAGTTITQWITFGDVMVSLITAVLAVVASRNLPGVLEVAVLKNLPIDAGSRYAITTVTRYLLLGIGIVVAFQMLGFSWSKLQWLVAAIGVGLGFGLQEIIANFVCGLILLFERPIRVGDTVTVGNIQGIVSRIRIRATTITDWDRMELIVPNKDLITGTVQNWTLTNSLNRVVVKVGVELDTDVERVRRVLIDAARGHPRVLDDPGPIVNLSELGPNALGFVVRCYLPDMTDRLATVHEIHARVLAALGEAGIRIASPRLRVERAPEDRSRPS